MAFLKAIDGHTTCKHRIQEYLEEAKGVEGYLENGDRHLGRDTFNLIDDEDTWASEMDKTRERFGNDRAYGKKEAITYKHFILSPDPEDNVDLETLRGLVADWVNRNFSEFQVVAVYHDDNKNKIPHAHIIVNNTNIFTGKRLHLSKKQASFIRDDLQAICISRGLRHFDNFNEERSGINAENALEYSDTRKRAIEFLDRPASEAQIKYISSLTRQGVIPKERADALGKKPTVGQANKLLNEFAQKLEFETQEAKADLGTKELEEVRALAAEYRKVMKQYQSRDFRPSQQREFRNKREVDMLASGIYTWKEQIRDAAILCARVSDGTFDDFAYRMAQMSFGVELRGERIMYTHRDGGGKKVSSDKLGTNYTFRGLLNIRVTSSFKRLTLGEKNALMDRVVAIEVVNIGPNLSFEDMKAKMEETGLGLRDTLKALDVANSVNATSLLDIRRAAKREENPSRKKEIENALSICTALGAFPNKSAHNIKQAKEFKAEQKRIAALPLEAKINAGYPLTSAEEKKLTSDQRREWKHNSLVRRRGGKPSEEGRIQNYARKNSNISSEPRRASNDGTYNKERTKRK